VDNNALRPEIEVHGARDDGGFLHASFVGRDETTSLRMKLSGSAVRSAGSTPWNGHSGLGPAGQLLVDTVLRSCELARHGTPDGLVVDVGPTGRRRGERICGRIGPTTASRS